MSDEVWKPVVGYELLYEVSNLGRVRSLPRYNPNGGPQKGRILSLRNVGCGYRQVTLCDGNAKKQTLVHRIVCEAFNGPPPSERHQVDHVNRDRGDNRAENLEWVTCSENIRRIPINPGNSHPVRFIDQNGAKVEFPSIKAAVEAGYKESEVKRLDGNIPKRRRRSTRSVLDL